MENNAMKNIFKVTALACLMAATSNAMAGPSANVSIKGTVKMGACTPTLDNGGVVDYGDISTDTLSTTTDTQLSPKYLNLTITCSANTLLEWNQTDNRQDGFTSSKFIIEGAGVNNDQTINGLNNLLSLGNSSSGEVVGAYTVTYMYPSLVSNIANVTMIQQTSGGNWTQATTAIGADGVDVLRNYSLATQGTLEPVAFTTLTMPLKVNAALDSDNVATLKDVVSLDGNATISLNYL
jgi:type 1 fimbria pilin